MLHHSGIFFYIFLNTSWALIRGLDSTICSAANENNTIEVRRKFRLLFMVKLAMCIVCYSRTSLLWSWQFSFNIDFKIYSILKILEYRKACILESRIHCGGKTFVILCYSFAGILGPKQQELAPQVLWSIWICPEISTKSRYGFSWPRDLWSSLCSCCLSLTYPPTTMVEQGWGGCNKHHYYDAKEKKER